MNLDLISRVARIEQWIDRHVKPEVGGGTKWLPISMYSTDPYDISSATYPFATTVPWTMTLQEFQIAAFVATTNTVNHYWNIALYKRDATLLVTLTTAAMAADTWTLLSSTGRSDALTAATIGLYIYVSKTGTPGNLSMHAPQLRVI